MEDSLYEPSVEGEAFPSTTKEPNLRQGGGGPEAVRTR